MKTHKFIYLILILALANSVIAQETFKRSNFLVKTIGLSESYAKRFSDTTKIEDLALIFNQLSITHVISPISLIISYKNGVGNVLLEFNYDHEKVFADAIINQHNNEWSKWGTGISVYLEGQIFTALSQYKKSVATQNWSIDKELLGFDSTIKLKKQNGDYMIFYAHNDLDYRGLLSSTFYNNVHMQIGGKKYETEAGNFNTFNKMNYFLVGKTSGVDGNKTGAYYFCKFFNINPN